MSIFLNIYRSRVGDLYCNEEAIMGTDLANKNHPPHQFTCSMGSLVKIYPCLIHCSMKNHIQQYRLLSVPT